MLHTATGNTADKGWMERREVALNVGCCRNHLHLPKCLNVVHDKQHPFVRHIFPKTTKYSSLNYIIPVKFHDIYFFKLNFNTAETEHPFSVLDGIYSLRIPRYFIAIMHN